MDVKVIFKSSEPGLRRTASSRVFGGGLFERTRNMSLAVLGFTAALGLGLIAFASLQGWPLVPGSPIPGFGANHQAIGDAAVVAPAKSRGTQTAPSSTAGRRGSAAASRPTHHSAGGRPAGGTTAPTGSSTAGAEAVVVSHP